jgi:acetyl/propionyl-CoA carboxylase alpha subunit
MRHAIALNQTEHELWLARTPSGCYTLNALGREVAAWLTLAADGTGSLSVEGGERPLVIAQHGDDLFIHLDGANHHLRLRHPLDRAVSGACAGADDRVRAPMPGTALSVAVQAGDRVARGATLLVIESMKLETTLTAPRDGVIESVHVAVGRTFERDAILVVLGAAASA